MIKAPHWAPNAIPTPIGWVNERRELLKSQKISKAEIDNFWAKRQYGLKEETVEKKAEFLTEAPVNNKTVGEMTETQVDALEQQNEVKVDREAPLTLTERAKKLFE